MSTIAAGAYLQTLRNSIGLSREDVARALKTSDSQIERIERGQTNTRGTMWFQVAEILSADLYQLSRLLTDENATVSDGVELARAWASLTPEERAAYRRLLTSNNGRAKLLRSVIKLSDDPELRGRAQGYLDSLTDH